MATWGPRGGGDDEESRGRKTQDPRSGSVPSWEEVRDPRGWYTRSGIGQGSRRPRNRTLAPLSGQEVVSPSLSSAVTAVERLASMVRRVAESGVHQEGRVPGFIGAVLAAGPPCLGLLPLLGWNCVCSFQSCSALLPLYSKAYILFCVVIFAGILATIMVLYGAIFRVVRANGQKASRPPCRRKARRLLNTVLMILVAFVVCWGPLFGLLLADIFGSNIWAQEYLRGMDWILALAVLNSAVNPLIYSFRSREVCRAVLGFLCCGCLRLGLRGPGDCLARAVEAHSGASTTDSSLRPRDSFRGSRPLSFRMREPLTSISSVRSI
ncbi:LOW QUALITY PROTEIN: sphingosine 1-phosphate receptor 4 [Myotis lucifugus]|uniref:LOW QUALITY PROTEIN: sphingosine 1-phosphate receptor 4 n=1 Tax=Myotis lucifugus TaxID=59463 RepID=UPI0003C4C900|nr:LOW QUALITY PROTEIN: sphingosine 1-phosphate receptor 4 [Myotis lucifugus]